MVIMKMTISNISSWNNVSRKGCYWTSLNAKSRAHTFSSSSPSLGQVNHEFEDSVGCSESYMPGGLQIKRNWCRSDGIWWLDDFLGFILEMGSRSILTNTIYNQNRYKLRVLFYICEWVGHVGVLSTHWWAVHGITECVPRYQMVAEFNINNWEGTGRINSSSTQG